MFSKNVYVAIKQGFHNEPFILRLINIKTQHFYPVHNFLVFRITLTCKFFETM